ncbi:MAG: type II toxin-antitoxin system RelB/DinJ family antitoxin [Lachnospiraceae bacterium]|jgi:DNA-damage-inducible protein J|nr:type II toxin-antitoxin system RelB/DinJ family antitoxin [Lachnospiraceae bacterium]
MATAHVNVRTDPELKLRAQQIFNSLGLDLSTAVNMFLRQTVRMNDLPFTIGSFENKHEEIIAKRRAGLGIWKGKYSLPDDFDSLLDDFKEYM